MGAHPTAVRTKAEPSTLFSSGQTSEVSLISGFTKHKDLFPMLDTLVLHVPLYDEFSTCTGNLYSIIGDIADYQIKAVPTYMKRDLETGEVTLGDLYHPFESLPTSFGGMAIKFYAVNVANTRPYIALNASVKILQGHNVYGGESVLNLASEMLHLLQENYPAFYACLDLKQTTISRIDSTYSVSLESERLIQPCLRFLANVGNGHRKADVRRDYFNTVYFGGATSRYGGAKIYGKANEMQDEIKRLEKAAALGSGDALNRLSVFTPDLLEWSSKLLRLESTTKRRQLERLNLPVNLWKFIDYQLNDNRNVLQKLWLHWFEPIIKALQGDIMPDIDDSKIYELCKQQLWTTTKAGNKSYRKANNTYNFYKLLKQDGFDLVKERYNRRTFNDNVKTLVDLGFSKSVLQNLAKETMKAVPVADIIKMDFSKQFPEFYKPVVSQYINDYIHFLKCDNIVFDKFPVLYGLEGQILPKPIKKAFH